MSSSCAGGRRVASAASTVYPSYVEELTIRTLDARNLTPVQAYCALRAKAPGRTSYLLEMTERDARGEQRSIIGFLAKQEAAYPPVVDALRDLATSASGLPAAPASADAAAACCGDVLALLLFEAVLPAYGVAPRPEQAFVGREVGDVAAVVFDHVAGSVTIRRDERERGRAHRARARRGACARGAAAGPGATNGAALANALREHVSEQPPDARSHGRSRARSGASRSGASIGCCSGARSPRRCEARTCSMRTAACARRRRCVTASSSSFATSPMFPGYAVLGVAREAVTVGTAGGVDAAAKELGALFPVEAVCGAPAKDALGAWREIAGVPLGFKGGAVARVRPGGTIEVLPSAAYITFEEEQLHVHGVAEVVVGRDVAAHTAAAAEDVTAALTAIRRAHDAAAKRERAG